MATGRWPIAALALLWLAGVVLMLGRLLVGWIWLVQLRRRSQPLAGSETLVNACRDELAVRRRVDLVVHPAAHAPVLLGGFRPAIAVPPNWDELPEDSRRAALLHELTHLAHYDDWAKAGEEVVRAFFFFHPLVRWLLNRLDGERERCCDAALVRQGMDPRRLAGVLLDFSQRLTASRPSIGLGMALPFFNRITVKDRIHQLLENDMTSHWIAPLSHGRKTAIIVAAFAGIAGLGSFGVRAATTDDLLKPSLAGANAKLEPNVVTSVVQENAKPGATEQIKGPEDVLPDELAGIVVDEKGQPLEGVHIHIWDWVDAPENQTRTGKDGIFRIKDCGRDQKVQVRFRKPGYSPVMFVEQQVGVKNLVVAMDSKTYFEGTVTGPDGKPAANALIRGNQGPKMAQGCMITTVWTDTKTDASGNYRLYVEPDAYEFLVKAPGVGVVRLPKTPIAHGNTKKLDFKLQPGVTFRALAVDADTGKPIEGVRLWHWEHKDVEGRSNAQGAVTITEMLPGKFDFHVEAKGYARWWSEEANSEWARKQLSTGPGSNWQRNFDYVDFDLRPDMARVTIQLEKGVRITGRVVVPDGKAVEGATVAPALTGSGNSLTGDTRFSVETKADGTFEVLLPASGKAEYNLVVHDGKYGQSRKWANGVLPPIKTTPGQEIKDVTLTLTRPAAVRGKVVDGNGKPVAFREVRAHAADKRENRYYDPTTTTKKDGTFELKHIRAGDQFIQAAPFWLKAEEAPGGSTKRLTLKEGESVEGIELVAEAQQ